MDSTVSTLFEYYGTFTIFIILIMWLLRNFMETQKSDKEMFKNTIEKIERQNNEDRKLHRETIEKITSSTNAKLDNMSNDIKAMSNDIKTVSNDLKELKVKSNK